MGPAFGSRLPSLLLAFTVAAAYAQFTVVGPAPYTEPVAREKVRALLENADADNQKQTISDLSHLLSWYRDLIDEELVAAWRQNPGKRGDLAGVIDALATPRVAAGVMEFSWRERDSAFRIAHAPLYEHLMTRYAESGQPMLNDLLAQPPELSEPVAETVCRILIDMPEGVGAWRPERAADSAALPLDRAAAARHGRAKQRFSGAGSGAVLARRSALYTLRWFRSHDRSHSAAIDPESREFGRRTELRRPWRGRTAGVCRCTGVACPSTSASFTSTRSAAASGIVQRAAIGNARVRRRRNSTECRVRVSQSARGEIAARIRHENLGRAPGPCRRADAEAGSPEQSRRRAEALYGPLDGQPMKKARIILLFMPLAVFADMVTLKDGTRITGTVEVGGTQILIKANGDAQVIAIERIRSIDFDPPYTPPAPAVTTAAAPPPKPAPAPSPVPAPVAKPQGITLPAGTEIAVAHHRPHRFQKNRKEP